MPAATSPSILACLTPGTPMGQINRSVGESVNEGETTCARRSDGSVWCWGGATGLSTGLGAPSAGEPVTYVPSQVNLAAPALAIAGHSVGEVLALLDTGEAFVWEDTLAANRLIYESNDLPVTNITHIDANKQTACVVADEKLSCLIRDDHHAPTARLADNMTLSSGTAFEVRAAPTAAEQLNGVIDMCMTDEAVCVLQNTSSMAPCPNRDRDPLLGRASKAPNGIGDDTRGPHRRDANARGGTSWVMSSPRLKRCTHVCA